MSLLHGELVHKIGVDLVRVFSFVFLLVVKECSTINCDTYHKTSNLSLDLHAPAQTWTPTTAIQCAGRCNVAGNCRSFTWDSADDTCTIGGCAMATGGMRAANDSKKLYVRPDKCRYDLGYQLGCLGTTVRCLYLSSQAIPYKRAETNCNELEGRLCKANSVELIQLIREMALENKIDINSRVYIGLTDLESEDIYVWVDGQKMTPDERSRLFLSGQPDGAHDENCAEILLYESELGLNDDNCRTSQHYVCEMDY